MYVSYLMQTKGSDRVAYHHYPIDLYNWRPSECQWMVPNTFNQGD